MTVQEGLEKVKFTGEYEGKVYFAKNLFLANKKKKDQMYLVVAAHDTQIDMKSLEKHLKTGSGNLRGGDEAAMLEVLGAKKGSLNLFSIVNDKTNKVAVIIDQVLLNYPNHVGFHPMQNDATTAVSSKDILTILEQSKHTFEAIDFTQLAS